MSAAGAYPLRCLIRVTGPAELVLRARDVIGEPEELDFDHIDPPPAGLDPISMVTWSTERVGTASRPEEVEEVSGSPEELAYLFSLAGDEAPIGWARTLAYCLPLTVILAWVWSVKDASGQMALPMSLGAMRFRHGNLVEEIVTDYAAMMRVSDNTGYDMNTLAALSGAAELAVFDDED